MLLRKLRRCESTENRTMAPSGEFHASGGRKGIRRQRRTLPNTSVTRARTNPIGCSEPVRALQEKHRLLQRLSSHEKYSRARKAHKKQTLNDEERNPSARSSNPRT